MNNKPKIFWIRAKAYTGGAAYDEYLEKFFAENYNLEIVEHKGRNLENRSLLRYYLSRIIYRIKFAWKILKINLNKEIKIRDFKYTSLMVLTPIRGKNITIIHHIDRQAIDKRKSQYLMEEFLFFLGAKKADKIVIGAEYWKKYFIDKGYKNVQIAYNCFEPKEYNITDDEVKKFKKKYNLIDKPIIYIGNCQKRKGVVETYNILKNFNVYLVTSGKKEVDIPAIHLDTSRREHLTLLKASTIVLTMSRFKEGWCRTAHEAMLLGTPVIGSGLGGMGELLADGKQIISDENTLSEDFRKLLSDSNRLKKQGADGRQYARKFNYTKFSNNWKSVLNNI